MKNLLAGWDTLDPGLARLLRINLYLLGTATLVLGASYAAGFRHPAVLMDLAVMVISLGLQVVAAPLTRRFGVTASLLALTTSSLLFAFIGIWATPNLSPLGVLLTMLPLLVFFPFVSRGWVTFLLAVAVLGSMGVVFVGEIVRPERLNDTEWVNALVVALAMPGVVLVLVHLVRGAFDRLHDQAAQLTESRTRIVTVADAARRSLERDLHDGAQQRLLAMSVTVERARVALDAGRREESAALITQLAADNREVLAELRELARGIYPPLLAERGLVAAVQAASRRSVVPVTLRAGAFERQGSDVETAAYFCILEALTNAAKHGRATEVVVTLRDEHGLHVEVSDNGIGFDVAQTSAGGLLGMEARLAAVGGTLQVESAAGVGTTVRAAFGA